MLLTMLLVTMAGLGQQTVPPPPRPVANGPSLEVTMKFIQDKLNAVGSLDYSISFHDTATGNNWVNHFIDEVTKVVADPGTCRVTFHERLVVDDKVRFDGDDNLALKDIQNVMVLPLEQDLKQHGEHPAWERKVNQPLWSLWLERPNHNIISLYFRDAETANRVANAVNHAVELCGGKMQAEPF
jgi:hypothetical protein